MNKSFHGFTLIELVITLAVFAILLMIGLPSMTTWLQNTQIRTSAETMVMGLQFARAEALKHNKAVRFQLVDSLAGGCALTATGTSWVVNRADGDTPDVTGACDQAESDEDDNVWKILQKRSGAEGTSNATAESANGAKYVKFNGLGRVIDEPGVLEMTQIDIRGPDGVACQDNKGRLRCLRLIVSPGGGVRMCDPAVDPAIDKNDPRLC